jgi:hypothetical protein
VTKPPSIAGALGLILGLVGVAVSLTNYKSHAVFLLLMAAAIVVAVGSGVLVASPWLSRQLEARVRRWVREEMAQTPPKEPRRDNDDVRQAANEVLEELEYVNSKVDQDNAEYWLNYTLPAAKWTEHGRTIARASSSAHAAVRRAYREVVRLNHDLHGVTTREYGPDGSYDDVLQSVSDYRPEDFKDAYNEAVTALQQLQ